ncbi:MAG: PAS domain S-box protein [Deltaproteobacteria bacterium]|nr:PAS domain S-box protein [Deltaproteobacteria bacterium]
MKDDGKIRYFITENFLLIGIILSLFFWLLEAVIHTYVFKTAEFINQIIPSDTNEFWMRILVSAILISFSVYARSILKKRKSAVSALKASEEKYRRIIETAEEGIWIIDKDARMVFVNQNIADMLGYTTFELLGKGLFDFMDEELKEQALLHLEKRKKGLNELYDFRFRRKDGSDLWAIVSATPIFDEAGNYNGALGMITDITGRKLIENALREERDRAQKYLDVAGVIMLTLDEKGIVTLINKKGCEVLGYTEDEIVGKDWFDGFIPEDIQDSIKKAFTALINGNRIIEYYENHVVAKGRIKKLIAWHNVTLKDEQGNVKYVLSSGEDITERRKAEDALKERVDELERFRKVTVEREFRMKELKDKILELEGKLCRINPN